MAQNNRINVNKQRLRVCMAMARIGIRPLSRILGVSHTSVWRWLEGKTRPTAQTLAIIESILNVSPGFLKVKNDQQCTHTRIGEQL